MKIEDKNWVNYYNKQIEIITNLLESKDESKIPVKAVKIITKASKIAK
jgi:hypothetical protein